MRQRPIDAPFHVSVNFMSSVCLCTEKLVADKSTASASNRKEEFIQNFTTSKPEMIATDEVENDVKILKTNSSHANKSAQVIGCN